MSFLGVYSAALLQMKPLSERHFKIPYILQADNEDIDFEILDYSPMGGVKISCDEDLKESDTITIGSARFAKTLATCVWQQGNTYGLNFAA